MAKLTTDQLIEAFKELSLIELSEFVKKFEEVFEVTAAAPVAVAAAPACDSAWVPLCRRTHLIVSSSSSSGSKQQQAAAAG